MNIYQLDVDGIDQTVDESENEERSRDKRFIGQKSLFSRKKIYKMFENKLIK